MASHWHPRAFHASHWADGHWLEAVAAEPTPRRRGAPVWGRLRPPTLPDELPAKVVLWDAHRRGAATLVLSTQSRMVWRWQTRRALPADIAFESVGRVTVGHAERAARLGLSTESRAVWRWRSRRALPADMPFEPVAHVTVGHAETWEWRHGPVRSVGAGQLVPSAEVAYFPGQPLWLALELDEEEILR